MGNSVRQRKNFLQPRPDIGVQRRGARRLHLRHQKADEVVSRTPSSARFDKSMSDEARAESINGIWLCEYDAKLIDNDAIRYPAALLKQWKAQRITIAQSGQEQGGGASPAAILTNQYIFEKSTSIHAPTSEPAGTEPRSFQ